jgi:hypothetical protein
MWLTRAITPESKSVELPELDTERLRMVWQEAVVREGPRADEGRVATGRPTAAPQTPLTSHFPLLNSLPCSEESLYRRDWWRLAHRSANAFSTQCIAGCPIRDSARRKSKGYRKMMKGAAGLPSSGHSRVASSENTGHSG